jgi:hypothetical protein
MLKDGWFMFVCRRVNIRMLGTLLWDMSFGNAGKANLTLLETWHKVFGVRWMYFKLTFPIEYINITAYEVKYNTVIPGQQSPHLEWRNKPYGFPHCWHKIRTLDVS